MRRSSAALVATVAVPVLLAGSACQGRSSAAEPPRVTALAASSLSGVFPKLAAAFNRERHPLVGFRFEFAGTDSLATQIEQGARADVFAGASTTYGDRLRSEGLIAPSQAFATNRLVLVVPPTNPAGISSPRDLTGRIRLVIGATTVPAGAYTRKVLANLDAVYGTGYSSRVLANVVSNEDSVEGVLAKVRLGEADAGFVYVTDARAAGPDVKTIGLPASAQAVAIYPIAVAVEAAQPALAEAFIRFALSPAGQAILRGAGFGPPPESAP